MSLKPEEFSSKDLDETTDRFNQELEARISQAPPITQFPPHLVRQAREAGQSIWGPIVTVPEAEARVLECPGGLEVPVRTLRLPDTEAPHRGVYLHIHGGGWALGAANQSDVRNRQIARLGLSVISVDYRLAPEHPYPAGPDDCEAVARWLFEADGAQELGGGPVLVGGESAGAHLSLVTMLRARARYERCPFAAANLVYGAYDMAMTPSSATWGERNLVLSTPIIEWFSNYFAGEHDRRDPDLSPLYADLSGLPPTLLSVGTLDPLLDDSLFLHARLAAAGNRSELAVYPGGVHGFDAFPTPLAKRAREKMGAFLVEHAASPD